MLKTREREKKLASISLKNDQLNNFKKTYLENYNQAWYRRWSIFSSTMKTNIKENKITMKDALNYAHENIDSLTADVLIELDTKMKQRP
jgi:hypothetical protein